MAKETWFDLFKIFQYAFTLDSLSKQTDIHNFPSAGITSPENVLSIRDLDSGGSLVRVENELVDTTVASSRTARYKEYDRLALSCPEIEMAMTVFADEACVAGDTNIETVYHGPKSIEWLANNKAPDERFAVYSYDFEHEDYTIGWAYAPRCVKTAKTVIVNLDNGSLETVTEDHRLLLRDGTWTAAGDLKFGAELMPFYRLPARYPRHNIGRTCRFPRIFTFKKGWIHERQFIDEWRLGRSLEEFEVVNKVNKAITQKMHIKQVGKLLDTPFTTLIHAIHRAGFTLQEVRNLGRHPDRRRVIGVHAYKEMPVYDLSVEDHKNFCTSNTVMHNCQKDEDGRTFKIICENTDIVEELEFLFFNRNMLNFDQRTCWDKFKRLCIKGDAFWEIVINPDNPKEGIYRINDLPPETMFRLETTRAKVLEYQQTKEQPDYNALMKAPIATATEAELRQSTAIRFSPDQIIHTKLGDSRKTFYPYGISLIEPARGPAHALAIMEDSMVVYRLSRAPERRVFYIDVGQLAGHKAEAFIDRIKDQFRKKKVARMQSGGASAVEERYHAPAQDEDFWVPMRTGSTTRIDTLPGASNLGEVDDTVFFRNKLFTALNFPKNYFSMEDPNATRTTLSAQDVKFARMIERLQSHLEEALFQVSDRHLKLRGYPESSYKDLDVKMTPPSDWRELSRQEIVANRIANASGLKSSQLLSDYDVLRHWMKYTEEETKEMLARLKVQKLEDLKLQVIATNPSLLGLGTPGQGEQEIGAQPGGPSPMLGPTPPPGQQQPPAPPPAGPPMPPPPPDMMPPAEQGKPLPDVSEKEAIKYDLEIQGYERELDNETPDESELNG